VKEMNTYCNSVLHLESMRCRSQEANITESKCRQLLSKCHGVCKSLAMNEQISEEELLMLSLMVRDNLYPVLSL